MSRYRFPSNDSGGLAAAFLGWLLMVVFGVVGWIANIVTIVHHIADPITAMIVLRFVGIVFFPLGAILGYL